MSKKDLSLGKYGISQNRYRELKYFCLQYDEWKQQLSCAAANKKELIYKCELVEQTAIEAAAELYQYILQSVTQGEPYECMDIPFNKNEFYNARKRFFFLLSEKR